MGSIKPFFFGAALGAGLAFVALQYHVIQSKDGFRIIPRTPQHSLGLTYADVRYWTTEQWADRPELVKALAADGSTDIVGGSIADDVVRTVAPAGGTLDQLRSFLNESASGRETADSLFDSSSIRIPEPSSQRTPDSDRFTVPFPDDARRKTLETAQRDPQVRPDSQVRPIPTSQQTRPSIDDVFSDTLDRIGKRTAPETGTTLTNGNRQPAEESDLLEEMLFGDDDKAATPPSTTFQESNGFGVFEEVTSSLEARAEDVMSRATQGIRDEMSRSVRDSADATNRFIRQQVQSAIPESAQGMFQESPAAASPPTPLPSKLPDAIRALRDGFDPFVE